MPGSRQAIVHIGAPKAGSTAIQSFLKANYQHWQQFGILAAGMTGAKSGLNHRSLYFAFHNGNISRVDRLRFRSEADYAEHRALQKQLIAEELEVHQACKTLVFSDEYLTRLDRSSIAELREFLESHGVGKVCILAYVREPGSLFLSSAQQSIKAHHELPSPIGWKHEFSGVLRAWKSVFPEGTRFTAFERESLKSSSVVDDFVGVVQTHASGVDLAQVSLPTSGAQNQSLTAEGMAMLLTYRRMFHRDLAHTFTPDTRQLILALQECAASGDFEPARLKHEWRDYLSSTHAQELLTLQTEFGISYAGINYDHLYALENGTPPAPPAVPESDLPDGLREVSNLVEAVSPDAYARIALMVIHKMARKASENSRLKRQLKELGAAT
ncbi:hypothetical protein CPCC7001_2583 [Cyanobium sp. PCC 7001]|uniref:hypothetical protein n=1 Tax=Cyanobium sp. PCC 7001 TaxID=180281 RepID=UPI0001805999|nr:hypothetical protein [Cyanobium sp. PCC 7001]EDY39702.1 hypothetical protein CPCC7001_2583 [Cyanobium sp. PCC 7001]